MIDRMDETITPAWEPGAATSADEVVSGAMEHEALDSSLSSIIGNARMIAMDAGVPGRELAQRLAAIIDSARKISLIVHQQLRIDHPADNRHDAGKSQPRGQTEGGAGERPCWT